jgi:hypothetical protein
MKILDTGYSILDTGYWILDTRYSKMETGPQITAFRGKPRVRGK